MGKESEKPQKSFTSEQKALLYFYRLKQYLINLWHRTKAAARYFSSSFYFYLIVLGILVFLTHKALLLLNISIAESDLHSIAFAMAGIIGASIAIIFSFSTFILQSTADLFSTQYLNKFVQDPKERAFFWLLVFLSALSFFAPFFITKYAIEALIIIFFTAFYLIFSLYRELRKRINPETTLTKIKTDAIGQLERINKELRKQAHIQGKIFKYEKENKDFSVDVQYKANPNWQLVVAENVKYLFEIGLRLLAKNEINSFNLTVKYIHDIYLKHLDLRNGNFIRVPVSLWGTYTFDDEGFTTKILKYFQSISERIVQEKRKENVYYLLGVYESILNYSLNVEYADKNLGSFKGNALLTLVLTYYIGFLEKLSSSQDNDWIWEAIESISSVSNAVLRQTNDYFICSQINQIIGKIAVICITDNNREAFSKEIVSIYFNQIHIGWDKYGHDQIFWNDLFKELKQNILLLSASSSLSLSISDLFINFHVWQGSVVNWILQFRNDEEKKTNLDKFLKLLDRWSHFLLDFARDTGLDNKKTGLPIIQSIDNNLRIIPVIHHHFPGVDLKKVYQTQFDTLSWYFQKTEGVDDSFLFNLEQVLGILLREINENLKDGTFDSEYPIDLYTRLVEQHFEKVTLGYGYNHPRVIEKLVYLGLLLHKYKKTDCEAIIITKIEELNKKYLELNKEFFALKQKEKNLMRIDEFRLCKELHDLENDLFSYNSMHLMDLKNILKNEITRAEWAGFTKKINHCKNVKYETRHFT